MSGHGLQVLDARIFGVGSEAILLVVRGAENVVSKALDCEDTGNTRRAEMNGMDGKITRLKAVDEGKPHQVTKCEHKSETISGHIHGRQYRWFHVQSIEHVQRLEGGDQEDRVRDGTMLSILMCDECKVQDDPPKHARSKLAEQLDVN